MSHLDPPPPDAPHQLFLYGSLLSGSGARRSFRDLLALRGQPASVEGTLVLLPGGYPSLVLPAPGDRDPSRVHGELVEILQLAPLLAALDDYEGYDARTPHSGLFQRFRLQVQTEGGEGAQAWVYACPEAQREAVLTGCAPIPGGDWRGYQRPEGLGAPLSLSENLAQEG